MVAATSEDDWPTAAVKTEEENQRLRIQLQVERQSRKRLERVAADRHLEMRQAKGVAETLRAFLTLAWICNLAIGAVMYYSGHTWTAGTVLVLAWALWKGSREE